jgi:hypothetical protein
MKMEQTKCSEMSAYKIQTPGNYPEENIQQYYIWLNRNYWILMPKTIIKYYA